MNAGRLIAKRYLFSRKQISLVNTLTMISITGVSVGTALLIVVLSVFNGFFDVIKSMLLSNDPDLRIEATYERYFDYSNEMLEVIRKTPEVASYSPYIKGKALVAHRGKREQVVIVKGVRVNHLAHYADLTPLVQSGELDLNVKNHRPGAVVSETLGRSLRLNVRDEVSLLSTAGMQRALTQFTGTRSHTFEIRGIYGLQQIIDDPVLYIDIRAAERLFGLRSQISGIDIRLHEHEKAFAVKKKLQSDLGDSYQVLSWYDLQKPLYDVMNLEKWGAYFILMIIVLVAVLNIVGSLTMIVIQKRRDIGLLRAIGYQRKEIMAIFFRQGWYIGLIGCLLGGGAGLMLCYLQDTFELVRLAGAESFIISAYPVKVLWQDAFFILIGSLSLCLAASWYPAMRAASVEPADAVRNE